MQNSDKSKIVIRCLTIFLACVMIGIVVMLIIAYAKGNFDSVESMQAYIGKFGIWAPLILTIIQATQVIIPVLPGFAGCIAGGVMFGPLVGFICNYIGICGGSIIAFLLAKHFGMPLVKNLFKGKKYEKWSRRLAESKSYTAFLFIAMVLPLFPDDFFCYMSGLTEMSVKKFTWIIILGKPWCILAYSFGVLLIK